MVIPSSTSVRPTSDSASGQLRAVCTPTGHSNLRTISSTPFLLTLTQKVIFFLSTSVILLHQRNCPSELANCGKEHINELQNAAKGIIDLCPVPDSSRQLDQLIERAYISLLASSSADPFQWRRLYSDASVVRSLADLASPQALDEKTAISCIARLDHALIITGAPGQGVQTLIQNLILRTQAKYLPREPFKYTPNLSIHPTRSPSHHIPVLTTSFGAIPRLVDVPSLSVFRHELLKKPFILTGFASDWPAMNEHPWRSIDYLRSVAGRGRVVPVEVGKDYRTDDWTQRMMPWDDFLDVLEKEPTDSQTIIYMAQHNLLTQFHALREDILIPDYVFTAPPAPASYPFYKPPRNEEELALNAWLGPAGTVSPAHTVCPISLAKLRTRFSAWRSGSIFQLLR